jgi:hypothetical protein
LPVKQYVIYTGSKPLTMNARIRQSGLDYHYTLLDMSTLDCERFIAEDSPDALVLAILCDFKQYDSSQLIEKIITRLIELTKSQPDELKKYLKMMEILSASRKVTKAFMKVGKKMLSEINIEKLPSYQIGIEQGIEREALKNVQNGIKKGFSDEIISAITSMSIADIKKIRLSK